MITEVMKRLHLTYQLSPDAAATLTEAAELMDFARYFRLGDASFPEQRKQTLINRLIHYLPGGMEASEEQNILFLINELKEPQTETEQQVFNIYKLFRFIDEEAGSENPASIDVALLLKLHKIALLKLPAAFAAGQLRGYEQNLFTLSDAGYLYPATQVLQAWLEDLFILAEDKNIHSLQRCWLVYYVFMAIKPFDAGNDIVARALCYYMLQREQYGFYGLLRLEKFVFHSKKLMMYEANHFDNKNYLDRLSLDLTSFLQICLQGFHQNLESVKNIFLKAVKDETGFASLGARQKNLINFWLEKGFKLHKEKLAALNERQKDVLFQILKNGSVSTSDLVPLYNVDRKTIQRDFGVLTELGIVEIKGGGRSLRYTFNLMSSGPNPLSDLSAKI